ncbi:MAG TPA: xanthine dehydrogenase family protein subunit M [Pseudomonas xinjiangensis]|uniref:Xanthine dehydrogenase family protein subunit M n=2 Tax=root TaxID=1 RepID=A0A7V1FQH8_9GAMM|nr:xanthine dehydrogenase family protein subunit M [Halopseudomonas xinjiangensis]HEC46045.1 xanthine dehydrogenase family protein subunit M [Halopseudomonas xinjiangensis]
MRTFDYARAETTGQAVSSADNSAFLAGGTNLLDLVKIDIMRPDTVVDINRLPLKTIERMPDGRLKIGALVSNTTLAHDPIVRSDYAVLSEALLSGASTQLRNKATTAGNLMQRVRCPYFRDGVSACNKRDPGSGCSAIGGFNRSVHAVLGTSDKCIASHPSDMCVAMAAIGAGIVVSGPEGERTIDFLDFHLLPGDSPEQEHALKPNELITHVILDAPIRGNRSHYLKLRDRASYQFALASSGVIVATSGGVVQDARIALGGVGTKPWRASRAEQSLRGKAPTQANFEEAARIAFEDAKAYKHNAFKIPLGQQAIVRSLTTVIA